MKNKPKKVCVFGQAVPIKYVQDIPGKDGEYDVENKLITIDKKLKGYDLSTTILHECFHAVFDRLGFTQSIENELEEVIVDTFSKFLVENFKIDRK